MKRFRSPSPATRAALFSLDENKDGLHGYDIMQMTGVKPGTLYPMLARLEGQGLMAAHWAPSAETGRPPRHIYQLTAKGRVFVQELRKEDLAAKGTNSALGTQS